MIGVDRRTSPPSTWLPSTEGWFSVPTAEGGDSEPCQPATWHGERFFLLCYCQAATAAEAAKIIRDSCLRFGDGIPDMLEADHDPDFTSLSEVLWASVRPATAWASASS